MYKGHIPYHIYVKVIVILIPYVMEKVIVYGINN